MDDSNALATTADIASAVTAIIALFVAYWSLKISNRSVELSDRALATQETHNRLTLKPIPFLGLADYEDQVRAKVTNDGAGPLVIRQITVSDGSTEKADVVSWMPPLPNGIYWSTFTSLLTDRAILPGTGLILLNLEGDADDPAFAAFRDECRITLAALTVRVEYTDIYESTFDPYQRAMDWFARDKGTRSKTEVPEPPAA